MDVVVSVLICFFSALVDVYTAVPPDICFQQFKWEDCGLPPKAVIYYYKSGSRCEVGFWRGCQPNPNMFVDEYECVQTCIFSQRAKPDDYHRFQENLIEETTTEEIITTTESAPDSNGTTGTGGENDSAATGDAQTTGEGATTAAEGDAPADDATTANGDAPAEGETAATEDAPAETQAAADGDAPTDAPAADGRKKM